MSGIVTHNQNALLLSQTIPYDEYLTLMTDLEANLKFVTEQLTSARDDLAAKSSELEEHQQSKREQDAAF
jgi:hypothetical protein